MYFDSGKIDADVDDAKTELPDDFVPQVKRRRLKNSSKEPSSDLS